MQIKINDKLKVIIYITAALVVVFLYTILYVPLVIDIGKKSSECRSYESQARQARNMVELAGKAQDKRVLITEENISLAIDELTKQGKLMGINFISIKPQEIAIEGESGYGILPIEIEVEAKDKQFSDFIGSLDSLKKGIFRIKSFNIVPDDGDRTRVNAKMTVNMYLAGK